MEDSAAKHFDHTIQAGLRAKQWKTQKGYAVYHVIRCNDSMRNIYPSAGAENEPTFTEIASRKELQIYSESEEIWRVLLQSRAIISPSNTTPTLIFIPIDVEFPTIC